MFHPEAGSPVLRFWVSGQRVSDHRAFGSAREVAPGDEPLDFDLDTHAPVVRTQPALSGCRSRWGRSTAWVMSSAASPSTLCRPIRTWPTSSAGTVMIALIALLSDRAGVRSSARDREPRAG